MRRLPCSCVAVLALTFVACKETSNPVGPDITPAFAATGVTQSATGSGHIAVAYGQLGDLHRAFTLTAHTKAGITTGSWQTNYSEGQDHRRYEVRCLVVVDNVAYVGGEYTDGNPSIFKVVDNGEGAGDPPDQISYTYNYPLGDPVLAHFCVTPTDYDGILPLQDVQGGNVQVRSQ